MAIVTLRPATPTTKPGNWTVVGAASLGPALSDQSDATYIDNTSDPSQRTVAEAFHGPLTLATSPKQRVKRHRVSVRGHLHSTGIGTGAFKAYMKVGVFWLTANAYIETSSITPSQTVSPWVTTGFNLVSDHQAQIDASYFQFDGFQDALYQTEPEWQPVVITDAWWELDVWQATTAPNPIVHGVSGGVLATTDQPSVYYWVNFINDGQSLNNTVEFKIFNSSTYQDVDFDPYTDEAVISFQKEERSRLNEDGLTTFGWQIPERLPNNIDYRLYVRVGKNDVSGETLWSDWDYLQFNLSLTPPATPTVVATEDLPNGRVAIDVTTGALTYDSIAKLLVERSDDGGVHYGPIRHGLWYGQYYEEERIDPSTTYTFYDHEAPRGQSVLYRASVTEVDVDDLRTSQWGSDSVVTTLDGSNWIFDVPNFLSGTNASVDVNIGVSRPEKVGIFYPVGRSTAIVVSDNSGMPINPQIKVHGFRNDTSLRELMEYQGTLLFRLSNGDDYYWRPVSRSEDWYGKGDNTRVTWNVDAVESDDAIDDGYLKRVEG